MGGLIFHLHQFPKTPRTLTPNPFNGLCLEFWKLSVFLCVRVREHVHFLLVALGLLGLCIVLWFYVHAAINYYYNYLPIHHSAHNQVPFYLSVEY